MTCALPLVPRWDIHDPLGRPQFTNVQFQTAQLLEALHADDEVNSSSIPSGTVIANDTDAKRTHLLIHQSSRLPSPSFMVTNLDASNMPNIKVPDESRVSGLRNLVFDRILCDVPCSGDGTMRKNIAIWKRWSPLDGNGLHSYGGCHKARPQRKLIYPA